MSAERKLPEKGFLGIIKSTLDERTIHIYNQRQIGGAVVFSAYGRVAKQRVTIRTPAVSKSAHEVIAAIRSMNKQAKCKTTRRDENYAS
jgi:hypothetical protein